MRQADSAKPENDTLSPSSDSISKSWKVDMATILAGPHALVRFAFQ